MDVSIKHYAVRYTLRPTYFFFTDKEMRLHMKEFRTVVESPVGLHARPASLFSRAAKESGCVVTLAKVNNGAHSDFVDGASILRVMTLGVKCNDEIIVRVEGENEEAVSDALRALAESTDH